MKEIDSGGAEDLSQIKLGDLSDDELRFLCLIRSSDKLFSKAKRLLLNEDSGKNSAGK
ncbi:MAG: hypothetical protein PUK72_03305 [Oscillospiraceae bacterium]|nr:hypothetical protein [Oscillospiraceae bacterium]MDD7470114.1 hypothetical protein [Oscillospiraceae bacterium]MDY2678480.1 hypothetical protein [Oscillospiraceae bacterium]